MIKHCILASALGLLMGTTNFAADYLIKLNGKSAIHALHIWEGDKDEDDLSEDYSFKHRDSGDEADNFEGFVGSNSDHDGYDSSEDRKRTDDSYDSDESDAFDDRQDDGYDSSEDRNRTDGSYDSDEFEGSDNEAEEDASLEDGKMTDEAADEQVVQSEELLPVEQLRDFKTARQEKRVRDMRRDRPYRGLYTQALNALSDDEVVGKKTKRNFYNLAKEQMVTDKISLRSAERGACVRSGSHRQAKMLKAVNVANKREEKKKAQKRKLPENGANTNALMGKKRKSPIMYKAKNHGDKPNSWQPDSSEVISDRRLHNAYRGTVRSVN